MPPAPPGPIAVIGAGIAGVSCALYLQRDGHTVTLLDSRAPGTATSFGNAGGIVTGAVVPNSTPALWRDLPSIAFDPNSAIRARWSYLPKVAPWLVRFLWNGRDSKVRSVSRALQPLSSRAYDAHRELVALSGAEGIVRLVGWLKVYETEAAFAHTAYDRALMTESKVNFEVLDADDIRQLEPGLARRFVKGIFQPDSAFAASPGGLVQAHAAQFKRMGGSIAHERVRGVQPTGDGVILDCELGFRRFGTVVIAAGAWSKELARQVGDRVFLETERGYHLNLEPGEAGELRRPVMFPRFVLAPMQDGIRLTSGVELAGLDAAPDFTRIRKLLPVAQQYLPGLSDRVTRQWMGHRPSTPDALPVIGASPHSPRILYSFGHQHLGLTLGPITGRQIAALLGGRAPDFDLTPYRIERF